MSAITKILNSKRLSAVVMAVIVLMLAGLTVLSLNFFLSIDHSIDMPMFLDGEYSVDGGEFKPYSQTGEITDSFNDKVVFKGKFKVIGDALKSSRCITCRLNEECQGTALHCGSYQAI